MIPERTINRVLASVVLVSSAAAGWAVPTVINADRRAQQLTASASAMEHNIFEALPPAGRRLASQLQTVDRQLATGAAYTPTGQGLIQERSTLQTQLRDIEHQSGLDPQVEQAQSTRASANSETDKSNRAAGIGGFAAGMVITIGLNEVVERIRRRDEDRRYAQALRQLT